jgi:outer membrane protein assembly factor BamB
MLGLLVLVLLVSSVSVVMVMGAGSSDSWPMFGHDLLHSGSSSSVVPLTNRTLWVADVGYQVRSSAAVVDDFVYAVTFDGHVFRLDARTGNVRWSRALNGNVWSSPAVANGLIFIGSNDFSIYALDADNGEKVWNVSTGGAVWSSPAVVGNVVYVGSTDGYMYALETASGSQIWSYQTGGQIRASPIVANNVVYVGSQDGFMYALDASSGNLLWRAATHDGDTYTNSSPAFADGVVYVGSTDGNVYAFNAVSGLEAWSFSAGIKVSSSPSVVNGLVYVGSEGGIMYCLNAQDGIMAWNRTLGSPIYAPATTAGNMVLISTWDGEVFAMDAQTGELVWNFATGGGVFAPAVILNGAVFVGSYDGNVYAFGEYVPGVSPQVTAPSKTPGFSQTNASSELLTTAWVPQPTNGLVAPVAAAVVTAAASVAVAAAVTPVGVSSGKAVSEVQKLLPSSVKSWLSSFVSSKRKLKVKEKTGSVFRPTNYEAIVYVVEVALLTVSFAYVKVEALGDIMLVLPTFFATSILVGFSKTFVSIVYSRRNGVWTEHKIWYFGLVLFVLTTFILRTPFSKPARSVSYSPKSTKKLGATIAVISILLSLVFAAMFFGIFASGFVLVGSAGLAMCVIDALFDTFPISPMNGRSVFDYSRKSWFVLFLLTCAIYLAWMFFV